MIPHLQWELLALQRWWVILLASRPSWSFFLTWGTCYSFKYVIKIIYIYIYIYISFFPDT
jgi:hypothetical protein